MNEEKRGSGLGVKLIAVAVLLLGGFILLRWVVNLASRFVTLALILLAVVGVAWALIALRRD